MQKKKKVEETVLREEVEGTICNNCGKEIEGEESVMMGDIQPHSFKFGYGSKFDMETWEFDLCDDCASEIVSGFKHPPACNG